ncbi:MAG: hypothetical protein HY700_08655 [Gemmatimonadetes bacterium]|nr:hypothetical protein [Gemmatimonadota bacterium]
MSLPFTVDQFLGVFASYNRAVWPAQVLLYGIGWLLAIVAYRGRAGAPRWIAFGLALLWAWMGAVYHLWFFRPVNPAAVAFGGAFLLQALLFVLWGTTHRRETAGRVRGARAWVGGALLGYALVAYPLLGWSLGHHYPSSPTFGVPCPTTIATLGLLVWVSPPPPWWLLVVPLLWVLVGSSAAFALGIREDLGLLAAGVIASAWFWYRSRNQPAVASAS